MFHFSIIVIKKLLQALATFLDPLIIHHSQLRWEPLPLNVYFLSLYNVPCCFYFVIGFCYQSTVVLLLSFFYDLFRILQCLI